MTGCKFLQNKSVKDILGSFVKSVEREQVIVSTKFTPQIAGMYENSMEKMADPAANVLALMRMMCTMRPVWHLMKSVLLPQEKSPKILPLTRGNKTGRKGGRYMNTFWQKSLMLCLGGVLMISSPAGAHSKTGYENYTASREYREFQSKVSAMFRNVRKIDNLPANISMSTKGLKHK